MASVTTSLERLRAASEDPLHANVNFLKNKFPQLPCESCTRLGGTCRFEHVAAGRESAGRDAARALARHTEPFHDVSWPSRMAAPLRPPLEPSTAPLERLCCRQLCERLRRAEEQSRR